MALEKIEALKGEKRVKEAERGLFLEQREKELFLRKTVSRKSKATELEGLKEEIQRLQELLRESLRERIKEFFKRHDWTIRYTVDRDTKTVITQLVERKTGEVVRQIPSEVALRIKATMAQIMKGTEEGND